MPVVLLDLVIVLFICVGRSRSYMLSLGGCVVYYEEACTSAGINFYLYTSIEYGRSRVNVLDPFEPKLPHGFNHEVPTKILVHGYGGLGVDFATRNVTLAYRRLGYNVLVVDWSHLGAIPCYLTAFLNTWHVGQCIAVLSVSLAKLGVMPNRMHIIGFSLGAHVASFASNHLKKTMSMPYYRITGLDPALPFFATLNNEWKLDKSDAPFVDVVHTSAGSFGKLEAIGHVDFYVNGGTTQPACEESKYQTLCSHLLVGLYYAKTIAGEKYYGFLCNSILHYNLGFCDTRNSTTAALVGENADSRSRGIYFVEIPITKPSHISSLRPMPLN